MKKLFTILFLLAMTFSVSAQFSDVDQIKSGFQTFADETANALPLAASMGLNWNDAYSGEFPHFGVGLTLGAVFLPTEAFEEILTAAGESIPSELSSLGIPLPVYTVDARLGLPKLPMDVGFKVGYLDPEWLPAGEFKAGYTMIGGDVRWAFFKDKGIIPDLSVGFGYTYLSGTVSYPVPDQSFPTDAGTVALVDSDMSYNWNSSVFDLKAQVSKKLLILNLSAGAGYSFGISKAGGGVSAATATLDGSPIDDADIQALEDATGFTFDKDGFSVLSSVNGGSFRVFGGVGLNIFILKIDFGVVYGLPSNTLGATTNVRIQY